MAFLTKLGNLIRHAAAQKVGSDLQINRPSIFQALRCMSSMASSKLFVGGISFSTDDQSLREAFSEYGEVVEARVIVDRETGRSRGFGFVTFTSSEEASSAIQALDGQDLHGRRVRVNYATDRARGFGGGGYGGGGYGGSSGGYGGSSGGYGGSSGGYGGRGGYDGGSGYEGSGYGSGVSNAGNFGGGDSQTFGGNHTSNFSGGSFGGSESGAGSGFGGDQFSSNMDPAGDDSQDKPLEGHFKDDFEDGPDYAKRA